MAAATASISAPLNRGPDDGWEAGCAPAFETAGVFSIMTVHKGTGTCAISSNRNRVFPALSVGSNAPTARIAPPDPPFCVQPGRLCRRRCTQNDMAGSDVRFGTLGGASAFVCIEQDLAETD